MIGRSMFLAAAFLLSVTVLALVGKVPEWTPVAYLLASLVTFVAYGLDKRRATRRQWRIPEANLHLLELMGGWPGGLVARSYFRHKTRKTSFLVVSSLIAASHIGFLAWYVYMSPGWL